MISIIICSVNPQRLAETKENIERTIGVEYELIAIDNRAEGASIASVYNRGARTARYPYLLFMHEDVRFHCTNWGAAFERQLAEPRCGVIGFAGGKVAGRCYAGWWQDNKYAIEWYYQGLGNRSLFCGMNATLGRGFDRVVAVDGFAMFVRREVWERYPFDEALLTGFHCYDFDFCTQIYATGEFDNYVCTLPGIYVEHLSPGNFASGWIESTQKFYDIKWSKFLPLSACEVPISRKQWRRNDEKNDYYFAKLACKLNSPQKHCIVWRYLCRDFTPRHIMLSFKLLPKYIGSLFR